MSRTQNVAELLGKRVSLEVESIDRMYLNVYVPRLQRPLGIVGFFRDYRGYKFVSSALMEPITKGFVREMTSYAEVQGIPVVTFEPGQRKDEVAAEYRRAFQGEEGLLLLGKAQEKVPAFRTQRQRHPVTGVQSPWVVNEDGPGEPVLLVRHGRGLRSVLPEVQLLLPLQCQVLLQRSRVRQEATGDSGRSASQPTDASCASKPSAMIAASAHGRRASAT